MSNLKFSFAIIFETFCFAAVMDSSFALDLKKNIEAHNPYQITSFVSENLTKIQDFRVLLSSDLPSVTYSFHENRQMLWYADENYFKSLFALQESLIIFYTNLSNEMEPFVSFLTPQLTIRTRPKCLIMLSSTVLEEINIVSVLKYVWQKKFLDFTVMVKITNSLPLIYYFNPFNDIIHLKFSNADIFPDKLTNVHQYPINISYFQNSEIPIKVIVKPGRGFSFNYYDSSKLSLTAGIMNFSVASSNLKVDIEYGKEFSDYGDLHGEPVGIYDYFLNFFIPVDDPTRDIVAFVPVIPVSRFGIFLKMFYVLVVISVVILGFLFVYNRFQSRIGHIEAFDIVLILLGQSVTREPKKIAHRLIISTLMVVSFIFMNDILSDVLSISFEKREMEFESYEDLYNSQLQTYTPLRYLKNPTFHKYFIQDPQLLKILDRTVLVGYPNHCLDEIRKWKNSSYITVTFDPELAISQYPDSDGSAAIKVANPPVFTQTSGFYWFAHNSPYALKFLEIMRRVRETGLMHWTVLVDRNREYYNLKEMMQDTDDIKPEHLLIVLSVGCSISIVVFVIEIVGFRIDIKRKMMNLLAEYLL